MRRLLDVGRDYQESKHSKTEKVVVNLASNLTRNELLALAFGSSAEFREGWCG